MDEFLTIKETAALLRVSPITIRRYIASGELAAERVGRGIRVRREAIEDFVTPIIPENGTDAGEPPTEHESLGMSIGIGRSANPVTHSPQEGNSLDEAVDALDSEGEAEPDEDRGKPFTMDDALWKLVGLGASDGPNDVASNKHKYLAEAILAHKSME
jgi:excisionase family DNA binding protein